MARMQSSGSITQALVQWADGTPQSLNDVIDQAYEELLLQARAKMRNERSGHTLQTRALISETYIRLLEIKKSHWTDSSEFFAVTASIMRRVLVDHARRKSSKKRGCNAIHQTLDQCPSGENDVVELLALDQALIKLEQRDATLAQVVELRHFGGLTISEVADYLNLSAATVKRKWTLAQAWLYRALTEDR